MPDQHDSIKRDSEDQAVAGQADRANGGAVPSLMSGIWTRKPKRTIADLVDDQEALASWRRNLARLRGCAQD